MKGYQIPVTVRFRDLDAMGHVNNAVYFTYFEEGRKYFFYHLYNVSDPSGFEFILARVSCDFMKPVILACTPVLRLWVKEIGRKSFNLGYQLMDEKDESVVYAKGESVQVCYDYKTQKSMEVSGALREKLMAYQMP